MALDFSTPAAIFFLFLLAGGINVILKRLNPRFSLTKNELIIVYTMMLIACAIPSMGLTMYLLPVMTAPYYYASPINKWKDILLPHLPPWLSPQGENTIRWFYEGLPKGASIPWGAWIKPLLIWLIFLLSLYIVMICIAVILRKQWMEGERLAYPLVHLPLHMVETTENSLLPPFFRNKVMWLGFAIPFIIFSMNALHKIFPFFPEINLVENFSIFRRTTPFTIALSFAMLGFFYLAPKDVLFSLWFFNLLLTAIEGYTKVTGIEMTEHLLRANAREAPIFAHIGIGAMITFVIYGFWRSRKNIGKIFRDAFKKNKELDDSEEILSYRTAVIGLIVGFLIMGMWLNVVGLPLWAVVVFLITAFILFTGLTRIVVESGTAAARSTMCAPSFLISGFGSQSLGMRGLASLSFAYPWAVDIRTFVLASATHGLKICEGIRNNKRMIFWAMIIALLISLGGSIWMGLKAAYTYGGINANRWFFMHGPVQGIEFVVNFIHHPQGPNWRGWRYTGIGAGAMLFLSFMRTRFLWWPLNPIGLTIASDGIIDYLWFTLFMAWLIKTLILKYGGVKVYRNSIPFFLGLVLGQYTAAGVWVILSWILHQEIGTLYFL